MLGSGTLRSNQQGSVLKGTGPGILVGDHCSLPPGKYGSIMGTPRGCACRWRFPARASRIAQLTRGQKKESQQKRTWEKAGARRRP